MPVCKHCGTRISKFDKDRCPVCGEKNPLEGVESDTIEITSEIKLNNPEFSLYKPRKRKTFLLLACFLGFTGAHFYYLGYKKATASIIVVTFFMMAFAILIASISSFNVFIGAGIGLAISYLINLIVAINFYKNPAFKDFKGNLLK